MPSSHNFFKINPFKRTLIYHLGAEAGFFSEFNNMVLAILYCYKHNINFKIYSQDAHFGYNKGWTDFFEPFCEEVSEKFHMSYNIRQPQFLPNNPIFNIKKFIYKILYHFSYYTHELWPYFRNPNTQKEKFFIENKYMDFLEASKYVIDKIWKYNKITQSRIDELVDNLSLPNDYAGIHIRRGDKFTEHDDVDIEIYMTKLQQVTDIKNIFVYTDDYNVVTLLRKKYSTYNFYTLVDETEHGYFHQDFINKTIELRKKAVVKMLASMDLLSKAQYCIGTYSANPGMFLGMRMTKGKMIGVDYDSWRIW